jgi:uncharacterized protein
MIKTSFKSPWYLFNGHLQTVIPSIFRKIEIPYTRERLELQDGDFLDIDWYRNNNENLVIVSHGLEGDSGRHYVTGMVRSLSAHGFDGLAWNYRSCSGEPNRLPRFYHHGDASDLTEVVKKAIEAPYKNIYFVGFSLGGSLTVRYLAENAQGLSSKIKGAIVASVPLDLLSSVKELDKFGKRFYQNRFLKKLYKKLKAKSLAFPKHPIIKVENYTKDIRNFADFDNTYTAPLHGYKNAEDFYIKASVKPLLGKINVPLYIIQAQNDPFLTPACLEIEKFKENKNLKLIITDGGGHVGFVQSNNKHTFVEKLAIEKFTI